MCNMNWFYQGKYITRTDIKFNVKIYYVILGVGVTPPPMKITKM